MSGQLLLACSGGSRDAAARAERPAARETPAAAPAAAGAATTPAQRLFDAYLALARTLAADDAKAAGPAFQQLRAAATDAQLAGDPSLKHSLEQAAGAGGNARDLAAARAAFFSASEAVLGWLRGQGNPLASNLRVAHCPMARDGKGARWLQTEPKLRNPYFGAEMLECGSIDGELSPGAKLE